MCRRPKKAVFFLGLGRFWTFCPLRDLSPLTGALTGRPPYGKAPYGETSYGKAPSRRFLTGDTFNYRKAYEGWALTGSPLQEEGRSLREGPVPYGKGRVPLRVLHREGRRRGLREAPYGEERSLREGPVLTGLGPFIEKNGL